MGLRKEELDQLVLLFGTEAAVTEMLSREMVDLRVVSGRGDRWDERDTSSRNLLECLRLSIDFFSRQFDLSGEEARDLTRVDGSADYIAMREGLVNQFIHQDYGDSSAAAQIEFSPSRVMFFNTGYSLVSDDNLIEGGKSQARNPLIARALRLIGFAELAGSGLRALHGAWRKARRRPPAMESDRESNTFTLTLDWREIPNAWDEVWKERLGVQLTSHQAEVLNLARDPAGISIHQAAAGTGLPLPEIQEIIRHLTHQVLVEERDGRVHLQPHLREALS